MPVKNAKKWHPDESTQRYLPFSQIRENIMIMKDGSSRIILKVHPVNFSLKSEEEQDSIIYSYQRFLNSLKFPVQILVRSLKVDIDGYITRLKNVAIKQDNALLQDQTYKYMDFLLNLVDVAQIMKKEFYIIIAHDYDEGGSVRKNGITGIFSNFFGAVSQGQSVVKIKEQRQRFEKTKKDLMEKVNTIKSSLESTGLRSKLLEKDELIQLMISHYNPNIDSDVKMPKIEDLKIEE